MRDWTKLPECDVIDSYIIHRLQNGFQTNVLVTGLRGKGKSSFGCRMAERLIPKINNGKVFSSEDIVDSFLKFLERLQKVDKPGECMMIEEASVLFPSKRAMSGANVDLGKILDVIRKKQVIVISNAPLWPSIDSHMRAMTDVLVECKGVLRKQKVVIAKAWKVQTNPQTGKTYRHSFRRDGKKVRLFFSRQSDQEIWKKYESDKDAFIDALIKKLKQKIEVNLIKENKDLKLLPEKQLSISQQEILDFWKKGITAQTQIAKILGISQNSVCGRVASLYRKGYNVKNYKKSEENTKKNEDIDSINPTKR